MSSADAPRWDVIGVGANSVDFVYRLPAYPQPDSATAKLRISSHRVSFGGQTTTTLCACAALGLRAKYIGVFGNDENAQRLKNEMARCDVDVADALMVDAPNAFAVILLAEPYGERIVLWDRHGRLTLKPKQLPADVLKTARIIHVDDVDHHAAMRAAEIAREAQIPVTSDIEEMTDRTAELVAMVSIPIFAEHALQALTGETDFERGLRKLRRTHDGLLCVTLGARGAMLLDGDRLYHEPGRTVRAIDTTGAGDIFRGAFIFALLRGDAPGDILRFANAAAAVSCTKEGAIASVPRLGQIRI